MCRCPCCSQTPEQSLHAVPTAETCLAFDHFGAHTRPGGPGGLGHGRSVLVAIGPGPWNAQKAAAGLHTQTVRAQWQLQHFSGCDRSGVRSWGIAAVCHAARANSSNLRGPAGRKHQSLRKRLQTTAGQNISTTSRYRHTSLVSGASDPAVTLRGGVSAPTYSSSGGTSITRTAPPVSCDATE